MTTIAYLRVLIIEIGSTIIVTVVEAQGNNENISYQQKWWCSMFMLVFWGRIRQNIIKLSVVISWKLR